MSKMDPAVRQELLLLHEEVMWLAARPNVTPSMARAWYTHVVAARLSRRVRMFSGKVSRAAASDPRATLRLEHHARIQATLTALVRAHLERKRPSAHEFARVVVECESVNIVTVAENHAAMRSKGDYRQAGIQLVPWRSVSKADRQILWTRMLRGKVANAADFVSMI